MNNNKNPNYTYGVDTNDHDAINRKYKQLKKRHNIITLLAAIIIIFLLFFVYDFINVNFRQGTPIFAKKERVDNGYKYSGIGYNALYCDNGDKYVGYIQYKSCTSENQATTYKEILTNKFKEYAFKNKIIDKGSLLNLEITNYEIDETISKGDIYVIEFKYLCNDNTKNCLKTNIEYYDQEKVKVFIGMDKYNEIFSFDTFRTSGKTYDASVEKYKNKILQYLSNQYILNLEEIRNITLKLEKNTGMFKYEGITYANSYLVNISYMCKESNNKCINYGNKTYNSNSFNMSMFLDPFDNIVLMDKANILNK